MKDTCREMLVELERYLDGECGDELEAIVRRHLDACPPCLDRADFQREIRALIASKCREVAPSTLVARVRASIEADLR